MLRNCTKDVRELAQVSCFIKVKNTMKKKTCFSVSEKGDLKHKCATLKLICHLRLQLAHQNENNSFESNLFNIFGSEQFGLL